MPKYRVTAVMRTYLETEVAAATIEEAREIAAELDGAEFTEQEGGEEWETFLNEIEEIEDAG